ncbi:META domain-containing protein [Shewanella gaetbuli]|uniref:META domain-containing protein n=1 Tax=Shewanella gaetbuli TaxID=220752 RepID=A0A9X1ZJZ0_9GAMM|nr:META domain-containing protein [Shewanella gaetbuli]MCL1141262.1 META domain-containing protein [Shewanella gaetbuli]
MIKHFLSAAAVIFSLSACQSTSEIETETLIGQWHIESVLSQPTIDYSPAKLVFDEQGKLVGNTSCNPFMGQYTLKNDVLTLNPAASTRKACIEALMTQERNVMQTLPKVHGAKFNRSRLLLVNEEGETIMVLSRLTQ